MQKKWDKTVKGRVRRLFDKFRKRWQKRGYVVDIGAKDFYDFFIPVERCQRCGRPFGKDRHNIKSVRVFNSLACPVLNRTITLQNLGVVHFACGCERNRYEL